MFDRHFIEISKKIGDLLQEKGKTLATAESCTGGSIAALITVIPGSSTYFKGGIVAYSNEVKTGFLQVSENTLKIHGAVSEETVIEMVKGAISSLKTDFAVATSGIAGPGGGTKEKPVGTVWMAAGCKEHILTYKQEGDHGRKRNVEQAVINAAELLRKALIGL